MNIGIIGAGAIATFLLNEINQDSTPDKQIISLLVRNKEKYVELEEMYNVRIYEDVDEFLQSGIDIVVEVANIAAVHAVIPQIILKKDVVIISIGAFADKDFYLTMYELAKQSNRRIHLPSGAIGGLDLLQNANISDGVDKVKLTTRKPAHTLIDKEITLPEVVFSGKAVDAIKQFPKNINVSIILSIAGLGTELTEVTIIADPTIHSNIHAIEMEGEFGIASFTIQNNPLRENPKTSHLAAMSVLGTLNRVGNWINIGG